METIAGVVIIHGGNPPPPPAAVGTWAWAKDQAAEGKKVRQKKWPPGDYMSGALLDGWQGSHKDGWELALDQEQGKAETPQVGRKPAQGWCARPDGDGSARKCSVESCQARVAWIKAGASGPASCQPHEAIMGVFETKPEPTEKVAPYAITVADGVCNEFEHELARAAEKFPDCVHLPDGTGGGGRETWRNIAKLSCDRADREHRLTHLHVMEEEFCEAMAETDPVKLRAELVQVGAMALKWILDIDSRGKGWVLGLNPRGDSVPGTAIFDEHGEVTSIGDVSVKSTNLVMWVKAHPDARHGGFVFVNPRAPGVFIPESARSDGSVRVHNALFEGVGSSSPNGDFMIKIRFGTDRC